MRRYSPGWGGIEPDDDGDYVEYAEAAARIAALEAAIRGVLPLFDGAWNEWKGSQIHEDLLAALAPAPAPEGE